LIQAFVILDVAAVGCDQCNPFGAVVGRSAAERDDEIAGVVLQQAQAVPHVLRRGVGLHTVKDHALHALRGKQVADFPDDAQAYQRQVGDDQGFLEAMGADGSGCITQASPHPSGSRAE